MHQRAWTGWCMYSKMAFLLLQRMTPSGTRQIPPHSFKSDMIYIGTGDSGSRKKARERGREGIGRKGGSCELTVFHPQRHYPTPRRIRDLRTYQHTFSPKPQEKLLGAGLLITLKRRLQGNQCVSCQDSRMQYSVLGIPYSEHIEKKQSVKLFFSMALSLRPQSSTEA